MRYAAYNTTPIPILWYDTHFRYTYSREPLSARGGMLMACVNLSFLWTARNIISAESGPTAAAQSVERPKYVATTRTLLVVQRLLRIRLIVYRVW